MRVVRALCALLMVVSCAPAAAAAQYYSPPVPADLELPKPLPPLYFPRDRGHVPDAMVRMIERSGRSDAGVMRLAQPEPEGEFRPISELPPEEKLPGGRMVVAAYAFVALALFAYVLSIARRLNAVGRDIARIEAQLKRP